MINFANPMVKLAVEVSKIKGKRDERIADIATLLRDHFSAVYTEIKTDMARRNSLLYPIVVEDDENE